MGRIKSGDSAPNMDILARRSERSNEVDFEQCKKCGMTGSRETVEAHDKNYHQTPDLLKPKEQYGN